MKDRIKGIFFDNGHIRGAEIYLLVALLVFGVSACFFLPVIGGYDEEHHLIRVWEMSSFTFLPNEKLGNEMPFPGIYWDVSYRRQLIVRAVEKDFWEKYGSLPLNAFDYIYSIKTRSVYSPPLLFPQAMVMRYLGRSLQLPALVVFYTCRLAGLLSYILLAWLAVRFIPYGKWVLAVLAASPVAILQASTLSADTISNGIAFFFIGSTLALSKKKFFFWKDWLIIFLLFLILFWGKVNIVPLALLPFLVFRPSQFRTRYGYVTLFVIALVLFFIEVYGWNVLAYSRYYDALGGADPIGQVKFILASPFEFLITVVENVRINFIDYFYAWAAIYPFNYWPVPIWTYYLFFICLLVSLLIIDNEDGVNIKIRISLMVVFILAYLGTIISLYLSYTPVGDESVQGVQGRYFVAVMPLLFLALANLPILKSFRIPTFLPVVLSGMSLILYIVGMYLSYHVPCGSQYYQPGLCYIPGYKNWAPNEFYSDNISEQLSITQEIVPECSDMTEVRFWMDATDADPDGMTVIILTDITQNKIVADERVLNSELPDMSWYTLKFPPERESLGKQYNLDIRAYDNDKLGPRIAYSSGSAYPDGKFYENDKALNKDLIFQTGCEAGWGHR